MAAKDDLVVVESFASVPAAYLAQAALEAERVFSHVTDEHTISAHALLDVAVGGVKLLVRRSDISRAREILASSKSTRTAKTTAGKSRSQTGESGGKPPSSLASMCRSILNGGKELLAWLLNPAPPLVAASRTYRRPLQLAFALFAAGAIASFVVESVSRDIDHTVESPSKSGFRRLMNLLEQGEVDETRNDSAHAEFFRAVAAGETEKANRMSPAIDWDRMLAPSPPRAAEILMGMWTATLISLMTHTLFCIVLGFLFGLYPAVSTLYLGWISGRSLWTRLFGMEELSLNWSAWYEPALIAFVLVSLLSAAIGLDMSRYIAQRPDKGQWFIVHIRAGLGAWGKAIVPTLLLAMTYLAVVLATMVILAENPVLR